MAEIPQTDNQAGSPEASEHVPDTVAVNPQPPAPSPRMPRSKVLAVVAVVLVILLVAGAFLLGRSSSNVQQAQKAQTIEPSQVTKSSPTPTPTSVSESTPTPVSKQLPSIPVVSTEGWKEITLAGVSFKIPPNSRCDIDEVRYDVGILPACLLYVGEAAVGGPSTVINVRPYDGGSRRQQLSLKPGGECNAVIQDAMFGNVRALQYAIDFGECQGGGGLIVAVVGNKLVTSSSVQYFPSEDRIGRYSIKDTIVSTLRVADE